MSVDSSHELQCAEDLLRRSTEPRNAARKIPEVPVEEMLGRPDHPVLVKNTTLLEYLDPVQDSVSRTFSTEEDLLSVFSGSRRADPAFDGLGEGRFRYEELYPEPYAEPYFMSRCGTDEEDFDLPVLLANSGWAWTGWHVDGDPEADVVSQLQRGRKLWFFESRQLESRLLTIGNKGSGGYRARSLPSTLLEDLKRNHRIQFCVQEAGDIVYFPARVCHCVLSGPEPTSLLTVTLATSEEEMRANKRKASYRQATGKERRF